jgi:hypothetical protein
VKNELMRLLTKTALTAGQSFTAANGVTVQVNDGVAFPAGGRKNCSLMPARKATAAAPRVSHVPDFHISQNLRASPPFERQESRMSFERLPLPLAEGRGEQSRVDQKGSFLRETSTG